ncbi:hypothetical protein N9N28_05185 [Rubripirellula amarantea]|uniref:Uncharacterized protein n=1 Tax=Rubripirellula amarantea TaxID=2527999 RepID=A0A5C5WVM6_9BACT|nr:hypothetical protein [Rubripirellula amarantea]MDA8744010.1 hypothetical protein [Rubripirellula amarantea]TWT54319.1 hypothetical protein Pla22_19650 [Rubripirellula amarantea]
MSLALQCPQCHSAVSVADEDAGHRVTCPTCQKEFLAPGSTVAASNDDDDWLSLDTPTQSVDADPPPGASKPTQPEADESDEFDLSLAPLPSSDAKPKVQKPTDDDLLAQFAGEFNDDDFVASTEPVPGRVPTRSQADANQGSSKNDSFGELQLPEVVIPSAPQARKSEPEFLEEYRVKCSICGTATYVRASQAGHKIKCNDCHSTILVPQPPKVPKKTVNTEVPQALPLQTQSAATKRQDPYQKSAADLLAEAEKADVEKPPVNYDTPNVLDWVKSVFGIFLDPSVIAHWLILTALISIPVYFTVLSQHPTLILGMFPFSIIATTLTLACSFAILESVANQEDAVNDWPVFDPGSWFGQMFMTAAAAGVALIPVNAVFGAMLGPSLLLILLNMFALYLVFPFVLLSMMDMGSPFMPFSPEVARSINKCQDAWGGLYFSSGLLFFGLFLTFVVLKSMAAPGGVFIAVLLTIGVFFAYFAMIGRLAYAIGQAVNEPARESSRT